MIKISSQINNIADVTFINTLTGEEIPIGTSINTEFNLDLTQDKIAYNYNIPRELNLTLTDCEFNENAFNKMIEKDLEKINTYKIALSNITLEHVKTMKLMGFKISPIKKAKSKRIQKKWNKKYGFRAINNNVGINDFKC